MCMLVQKRNLFAQKSNDLAYVCSAADSIQMSIASLSESAEVCKIHSRLQDANQGTKCKSGRKMQL